MINRIVASVKLNQIFTCADCGKQTVGETERYEWKVTHSVELKHAIDSLSPRSFYMLVVWSYDGAFHCGCRK
jgi:transcription elongation factor Elf1